jgi:Spy/CpxP family protein refolding chaperone
MKTLIPVGRWVAVVAACVLLGSTTAALAQAQGQGPGGRGGTGGIPNASEEQIAALRELNQSLRPQLDKLVEARTALSEAIYAEKVDEAAIKAKVAALMKVEEELAVARAQGFAKIRSKFTAEQITALKAQGARGGGFGRGGRGGGQGQGQGGQR